MTGLDFPSTRDRDSESEENSSQYSDISLATKSVDSYSIFCVCQWGRQLGRVWGNSNTKPHSTQVPRLSGPLDSRGCFLVPSDRALPPASPGFSSPHPEGGSSSPPGLSPRNLQSQRLPRRFWQGQGRGIRALYGPEGQSAPRVSIRAVSPAPWLRLGNSQALRAQPFFFFFFLEENNKTLPDPFHVLNTLLLPPPPTLPSPP